MLDVEDLPLKVPSRLQIDPNLFTRKYSKKSGGAATPPPSTRPTDKARSKSKQNRLQYFPFNAGRSSLRYFVRSTYPNS